MLYVMLILITEGKHATTILLLSFESKFERILYILYIYIHTLDLILNVNDYTHSHRDALILNVVLYLMWRVQERGLESCRLY